MVELEKEGKYNGLTSPDDSQTQKSNEFTPPNLASSIHYPVSVPMNLLSGLVSFCCLSLSLASPACFSKDIAEVLAANPLSPLH